ncbi:MAG: hypothetical protein JEZ07_13575 [Phycisphaerae bacterium]|nr:hypothetical protein [Phycisphaerae bacterium]
MHKLFARIAFRSIFVITVLLGPWADSAYCQNIVVMELTDEDQVSGHVKIMVDGPGQEFLDNIAGGIYDGQIIRRVMGGFLLEMSDDASDNVGFVSNDRFDFDRVGIYINLEPGQSDATGQVVRGADLFYAITEHEIMDLVPSVDESWVESEPIAPIIIKRAYIINEFDDKSCDFSEVDYIKAKPGDIKVYRGKDQLSGSGFIMHYSQLQTLGVECLVMQRSDEVETDTKGYKAWVARDKENNYFLFKYEVEGEIAYEASDFLDLIPFSDLDDVGFSLADYARNQPALSMLDPSIEVDDEIIAEAPFKNDFCFLFYNPRDGLVSQRFGDLDDEDATGWYLEENPAKIELVKSKFEHSQRESHDSFMLTGTLKTLPSQTQLDADEILDLRVGSWSLALGRNALKIDEKTISYKGYPQGSAYVILKIDRKNGKFEFSARKINLTGLAYPVVLEFEVDDYYANAVIDKEKLPDLSNMFMAGYADTLEVESEDIKLKINSKRDSADNLEVKGKLAMRKNIDLNDYNIVIRLGPYESMIPAGAMRVRNGSNYVYRQSYGSDRMLYSASFDMDKGEFEIVVKDRNLKAIRSGDKLILAIGAYYQSAIIME